MTCVPLTGLTSLCCAKAYCFARYTRKALGLKTPHRGVFFTASPLSGSIPISKNTGYPIGVSLFLMKRTQTAGSSLGSDPTAASGGVKGGERVAAIGR